MFELDLFFEAPLPEVFAKFADINAVPSLLCAHSTRSIDGAGVGGVNGVGAVRKITLLPFLMYLEEEIKTFSDNELIEYTIVSGGIVNKHWGRMEFSEDIQHGITGTRLLYNIELAMNYGLTQPVNIVLKVALQLGFKHYQKELARSK